MSARTPADRDPGTGASLRAHDLVVTRVFDAPRELMWQAWIQPERVARWWGPGGFTAPVCELDARPGGAIRIHMRAPDGAVYPMEGSFREVVRPERLVFTASALGPDGAALFETLNTLTFAETAGRTTLRVEIRVLWATDAAAVHLGGARVGWTQQLERLDAFLGGGRAPAVPGTTFAVAGEGDLILTAAFPVPRWMVYLAWTRPERYARWWGPPGLANHVQEMDVRPGGAWRVTQRAPDGSELRFHGTYREVAPPGRLIFTQVYGGEGAPGNELLCTVALDEAGGRAGLTATMQCASAAGRDAMLRTGMEWAVRASIDRLVEEVSHEPVEPQVPWDGEIVAARVLAAPRSLVWQAWTDPRRLARWWGPHGFTTTIREIDVRAGAAWRLVMHGPDGTDYDNEVVFDEVAEPERLVYTHVGAPRFRQEVALVDLGGTATMLAMRSVFAAAADAQPYAVGGLRQGLERLEAELAAAAGGPVAAS